MSVDSYSQQAVVLHLFGFFHQHLLRRLNIVVIKAITWTSLLELWQLKAFMVWRAAFGSSQVWEHAAARVKSWLLSSASPLCWVLLLQSFCSVSSSHSTLCWARRGKECSWTPLFTAFVQYSAISATHLRTLETPLSVNCVCALSPFLGGSPFNMWPCTRAVSGIWKLMAKRSVLTRARFLLFTLTA